jgi:hypothetical protein
MVLTAGRFPQFRLLNLQGRFWRHRRVYVHKINLKFGDGRKDFSKKFVPLRFYG